jgi:formylmethanofuran dehydrogenase subunit C
MQIRANSLQDRVKDESFASVAKLGSAMPKAGSVLVSGSHCVSLGAYMVSDNAPLMF